MARTKGPNLHDKHPTGKSKTTRGAPNGYYLVASGNPAKNTTGKLHRPANTDDVLWSGVSPFFATNDERQNRSAAVRTTMSAWINAVKVDSAGEYYVDYLTAIFLAWIWQLTRDDSERIFSQIQPGTFVRYPFDARKVSKELNEVVRRTYSEHSAIRILNGATDQLKEIVEARKKCGNVDMLPFAGMKASRMLTSCPEGFVSFVRSLINEHPLEIALAVGFLHMSPPAPPLSAEISKTFSAEEIATYEETRKQQRQRMYKLGRLALTCPPAAMLEAQRMMPTSHPIDPKKLVKPIEKALQNANCLTEMRQEELAVAGSLPKKLSRVMSCITRETSRCGGVEVTASTVKQSRAQVHIDTWLKQSAKVEPRLLSHFQTEDALVSRSTAYVIDALRKSLRIVVLPSVFKTATDFCKVLDAAKIDEPAKADNVPVPKMWYDPDALIPKSDQPSGAVGIIVRAGKPLTWATLSHCWTGGYTTIVIAVQVTRAIRTASVDEIPLAMQLVSWGVTCTETLFDSDDVEQCKPVCCKPYLLAPTALQAISDQPQCQDANERIKRLEEHSLISADVRGAGSVAMSTVYKLSPRGEGKKRKRDADPLEFTALLRQSIKAVEATEAETPKTKRPKVNLNKFVAQPRGTRPTGFKWNEEEGRYDQVRYV